MTYTDLHLTINGVRLHVIEAGDPSAPLVLLLHGFPEFWYGWRHQIDFLAANGFRVWAPDQRGYNLSDKPTALDDYRLDLLAADVAGLIDVSGQEQVCLVGHDWGGAVAWWTALLYPTKLRKLAVLNLPHPSVVRHSLLRGGNLEQMFKSWYILFFQLPFLPEWLLSGFDYANMAQSLIRSSKPGTFRDHDIARYMEAWKQPGALTAMLNWYRALAQRQPTFPADERVHVPTLILWGAQDQFLSRAQVEPSAGMCDDARYVIYEVATHWVQHEKAAAVNAELLAHFTDTAQ